MHDQESLAQLQATWPETADYLQRVGQVNNDLMVLRDLAARDEYEASLTWLDHLAVDVEDLTEKPSAVMVLWFLHRQGIPVKSAVSVPAFQEIQDEHEAQWKEGGRPARTCWTRVRSICRKRTIKRSGRCRSCRRSSRRGRARPRPGTGTRRRRCLWRRRRSCCRCAGSSRRSRNSLPGGRRSVCGPHSPATSS